MEKRVHKYPLKISDRINLSLPKDAKILTVQTQFNEPMLWALVDPTEKQTDKRRIEIYGTGHSIDYDEGQIREYIGTFQTDDGDYVFHVFERLD